MASPRHTRPPHTRASSVARSLANAAAALRAQEWRGVGSSNTDVNTLPSSTFTRRQIPRYENDIATSYTARYSDQEEQSAVDYDRAAFYEELRERHRNLMERQRLAREFFTQNLQPNRQRPWGEEHATSETLDGHNASKRQRVVSDRTPQRRHQPPLSVETHSRSSSYPPPRVSDESGADRTLPAAQQTPDTTSSMPAPVEPRTRRNSPSMATETEESREPEDSHVPSVIEDAENEAQNQVVVVEDDASAQKAQKKRVRYLRDTDRRNIIKRIENGEKQAALAREFGVTRAAICHIKKNRFEILSRYNSLVQSAQEIDRADNFIAPPDVEMRVHQVRAKSVLLLMTMLRDKRSNGATFRRVAGRLIMILLEETLGLLGTGSVEVVTGTGHLYRGLGLKHQFCGVAIGTEGFPFLVLFHQMEPEAPQGSIHVQVETDRQGKRVWRLDHMDLPANIVQHKVLLFSSTCSTGNAECKAIEALCSVGCDERSISLVVILVASDGIVSISSRYPQVKIITGAIDGAVDPHSDSIVPGFGDFVSRYNGS
ncbi:uncharacterized protein PITG_12840 [Phytophthora infestans T30-4]|uniref:Uncharacterized protein n=1 Tax=Phytophthora infestans (strain T30-4) TaxID=403677 RepID=D0NLA3_PHYIT|nr:uncharacterized protein PITG_12840 [Phytophthora infestans T30-4]EEY60421.1 conserved hypothetical protein [Phytophthora infestans T30-4]|eukprot:XP_002900217.1 conserved hypothetical protein [Phytophthora infestans T30-4]